MSAWDVVIAAMDETAAEKQLTQWQATILVWGGLSWGPTNQLLLDAAIDYLGDCRNVRRDAIAEFIRPHCGNRTLTGDHHAVCDCPPPTEPAPFCVRCTSAVCVCGVGR